MDRLPRRDGTQQPPPPTGRRKRVNEGGQGGDGSPANKSLRVSRAPSRPDGPSIDRRSIRPSADQPSTSSSGDDDVHIGAAAEVVVTSTEPSISSQAARLGNPRPVSLATVQNQAQQLSNISQGGQRAAVVFASPDMRQEVARTPGVHSQEVFSSAINQTVIVCWGRGAASERAAQDYMSRLAAIDQWNASAKANPEVCDNLRRQMRDSLLFSAQVVLVDGDLSCQEKAHEFRRNFYSVQLPNIVGGKDLTHENVCRRVFSRFLTFQNPEQLREKMKVHLNEEGFWDGRTAEVTKNSELKEIVEPTVYGDTDEACCVKKAAEKVQTLQRQPLSNNPIQIAADAKKMICELDKLEQDLLEACQVSTGVKNTRTKGVVGTFLSWFAVTGSSKGKETE